MTSPFLPEFFARGGGTDRHADGWGAAFFEPGREEAAVLFRDEAPEKRRRLEEVMLKVGDRFGGQGLTRASLLEGEDPARGRRAQR